MKNIVILYLVIFLMLLASVVYAQESLPPALKQFEKANELLEKEDYKQAAIEYQKVVTNYPKSECAPLAQSMVGIIYTMFGNYKEAKKAYQKVINNYPNSEEAKQARKEIKRLGTLKVTPRLSNKEAELDAWADLDAMSTAMEMYYLDCDSYPAGAGKGVKKAIGINALVTNMEKKNGWAGPYMKFKRDTNLNNIPEDPWGNEYEYEAATSKPQNYFIWCKGSKGDYKAHYVNPGPFGSPREW